MSWLKRIAAALPDSVQFELEGQLRGWRVRRGRTGADEPEFALLPDFVSTGDWVLDIGANVGAYTLEMARLVGDEGRVVALEPMCRPFAHLSAMVVRAGLGNVTLINMAASDRTQIQSVSVPRTLDGLPSYYQARLVSEESGTHVMTIRIDDLPLPRSVALAKIDVEGHEIPVLQGMRNLIERCRPILIVEDSSEDIRQLLGSWGYEHQRLQDSPNRVYRPGRNRQN